MSSSRQGVAKAAGVLMVAIFLSRVLGFLRERAIAEVFGRTGTADVFFAAFSIPDLMYQLLVGGALSSAFIPVFSQYLAMDEEKEAWEVASTFINLTILALFCVMVLGVLFTPYLAPLVGVGFSGEQRETLILLMRITFPAVFFTALSGLEMGVLNSYQKFFLPALGPILYNTAQILSAYILGPVIGIVGMAYGTVAGSFSSFLVQFPSVLKKGRTTYRGRINLKHPGIKRMGRLMIPAIIGLSIAQVNLIVGVNLASLLEPGSIAALRLANRLIHFPLGIFAMGISTAVFPTLARLAARGEREEFAKTFSFGLRLVLYITIPSAIGLAVLRVPVVRFLFESGEFTAQDTIATAMAVLFFAPGMVAQAGLQVLTRVFYSLQDTVTPLKIGLLTVLLNFLLSVAFLRYTSLLQGGLALAFSLTSLFNVGLMLLCLRRKLVTMDGRRILTTFVKATVSALFMGLLVFLVASYLEGILEMGRTLYRLFQTAGAISVGILFYLLLSLSLKMEEPTFVLQMLKRRFLRGERQKG